MGTAERVVLPSMPWRLTVAFVTLWSLIGLPWLGVLLVDGPSVVAGALVMMSLCWAAVPIVQYRTKVVVTSEGVTHRPVFKTRLIPWSEIRKVDQISRVKIRYMGFWTSERIVEAAWPSEADYQRIVAMRGDSR